MLGRNSVINHIDVFIVNTVQSYTVIGSKYRIHHIGCRSFSRVGSTGADTALEMCSLLSTATSVADVMEELGYSCTVDIDHCRGVLGLFPTLTEIEVARILGMVARTHRRSEDLQGTHSTFCTALCNDEQVSSDWLTTWDVDVLVDSIKQLVYLFSLLRILICLNFYLPYV